MRPFRVCSEDVTSSFHSCSLNSRLKKSVNNYFQLTFSVTFIFLQISNIILPFPLFFPHFPTHRGCGTSMTIPAVGAIPLLLNLPITFSSSTLSFPRAGIQCYTQCSWHTQKPRKSWQNQSWVELLWLSKDMKEREW